MIYTATKGVDRRRWQRFVRDSGIALPLIAILFIIVAALSASTNQSSGQSPYINAPGSASKPALSTSSGHNSGKGGSSKPTEQSANTASSSTAPVNVPTTPAMSMAGLSSTPSISTPPTTGVTGGLGGGDVTSGGGSDSTGDGGSSSTPTPTVVCTNLLSLSQICTACVPTITLQPGQKALMSADGTCIAVN